MSQTNVIEISFELDDAGLLWQPEIGDEVVARATSDKVSILVDPMGLTPKELRECYVWIPTVEQMVTQIEARQALIFHAGITDTFRYEVQLKYLRGMIEQQAKTFRIAFGKALRDLLNSAGTEAPLH